MIELNGIKKIYKGTDYETRALMKVDLKVEDGEFISIMGTSGSGKSTLLNIIGLMDKATGGSYILDGIDTTNMSTHRLNALRKANISFVFQNFALMKEYTVYENVEMPLIARNYKKSARKALVCETLEHLGISDIIRKTPDLISGGQQQRVAIARALVTGCKYILADEPTGALDSSTTAELMELLRKINADGKTIILVTHDEDVARYAKRTYYLDDGILRDRWFRR